MHGPGYSKVLLGPDMADEWPKHLDVIASSIAENGGRSCVNASGVWTATRGREIAEALAARFATMVPRAEDDPQAQLAPFANPDVARRISAMIDRDLEVPGAEDVTARHRPGPRVVEWEGSTYLLPTVVRCDSPEHPLANREFLFPFAAVVEVPAETMPAVLGPTLAVTVLTADEGLRRRILASPLPAAAEPRPAAHVAGELGPAARGQPLRAPLHAPVPLRGGLTPGGLTVPVRKNDAGPSAVAGVRHPRRRPWRRSPGSGGPRTLPWG